MKKFLFTIILAAFCLPFLPTKAQSILDDEEQDTTQFYYKKHLFAGREVIKFPHLRENDVAWETCVWRSIDFREKFNQFFYFPTSMTQNTQNRINLANCILAAWKEGEFQAYEDDDMKIPISYAKATSRLRTTSSRPIMETDEETGEEVETGEYAIDTADFKVEEIYKISLKEYWYIDKQDTRQKVRIVGLALVYNYCMTRGEGEDEMTTCSYQDVAWFPMNDLRVREALVHARAYDERNINAERSYDDIFIDRYFDSYVTRESNRFNRTVSSYLTGEDALLESENIEDNIFNIESDMWEY